MSDFAEPTVKWAHSFATAIVRCALKHGITIIPDPEGVFDMFRRILKLTLALCLGATAAPAAQAHAAAPITEQEAHAIAVDANVYFYPI